MLYFIFLAFFLGSWHREQKCFGPEVHRLQTTCSFMNKVEKFQKYRFIFVFNNSQNRSHYYTPCHKYICRALNYDRKKYMHAANFSIKNCIQLLLTSLEGELRVKSIFLWSMWSYHFSRSTSKHLSPWSPEAVSPMRTQTF